MNNSKTKYEWINGIKGIACLIVATNHIHNLFPEVKLPSAICNGQFMVSVFILLSILLASMSIFKRLNNNENIGQYVVSRWISIFVPVLIIVFITLIGFHLGIFRWYNEAMSISHGGDPANNYSESLMNIKNAIKVAVLAPTVSQKQFVFTIWMLPSIFIGNMIAIVKCIVLRKMNIKKATVFIGILFLVEYFFVKDLLLILTTVGVYLGYILFYHEKYVMKINKSVIVNIFGLVLFIIGILVDSRIINSVKYIDLSVLGPIFIVLGIYLSGIMQKVLALPILSKLGTISMGVYYIHQPITTSLCCGLLLLLTNISNNLVTNYIIIYLVYYIVIILLGYVFDKLTRKVTDKLKKIVNNLMYSYK